MAQLRDVRTSEVVFEGTPLECIVVAGELGGAAVVGINEQAPAGVELIYDDVGLGFDPDAVLAAARENADGLAGAASSAPTEQRDEVLAAAAGAAAELEVDAGAVGDATANLEAARARLEG